MLEMLITVGITVILLAFSAVGVARFRENLRITELDNAARAIYMAAENRAVLLHNRRRLDKELTGTYAAPLSLPDATADITEGTSYVLWDGTDSGRWGELLPAGTIDPALREGKFYIVYEAGSGSVTDVFYSRGDTIAGIEDAFKLAKLGRDARMRPRDSGLSCPMLGWFGGGSASEMPARPDKMGEPQVIVEIQNDQELTVKVTFTTEDLPTDVTVTKTPSVKLTYGDRTIDLLLATYDSRRKDTGIIGTGTATCTWVLDSLEKDGTGNFKYRFRDLVPGSPGSPGTMGSDFTVTARLTLSAAGYEDAVNEMTTPGNSLFAEGSTYSTDGTGGIAKIANLRHLQNLHPGHSDVGPGVVWAEQTENIDCAASRKNDWTVLDEPYKFTPITNGNLTYYTGRQKEIRNLCVEAASGNAGLFGTITAASTVEKVRLVDAAVSTSGAAAGALAGEVSGDCTFDDCRVYWSDSNKLVTTSSSKTIIYKVKGANTGGLAGAVNGGTVTVKNSFAATTVQGAGHTGGLVGARTNGILNINNSYADCYLKGGTGTNTGTGGLVGSGTVNRLENCYAAGFITRGANTAGLVNSDVTNAARTYSAVRVMTDVTTLTAPDTPLYTGPVSGTVKYLDAKGSVTNDVKTALGDGFEYTDADDSPETTPYNLRRKVNAAVPALPDRYIFPGVRYEGTDSEPLPHYGDWGELARFTAGLVYYERYSSNAYKMEGQVALGSGNLEEITGKLESGTVVLDGYALAFERADAMAGGYEVEYGAGDTRTWTLEKSGDDWQWKKSDGTTQGASLLTINGKTVIPLPEEEVTANDLPVPDSFYQQLTVRPQPGSGTVIPRTYYFNPHFARSVKTAETADPTTEAAAAIVRTPRHLYDLSKFQDSYVVEKNYYYKQELNLDYVSYTGYDIWEASAAEPFRQDPIGKTDADAFTGKYDGGLKTISGVLCKSDSNTTRGGLFGSSKGTLQKIVYDMGGGSWTVTVKEGSYYGGAYFGGLLGCNYSGTVQDCTVRGVNMTTAATVISIGGMIGYNNGEVTNCSVGDSTTLTNNGGGANVGGLVGWNAGDVTNCSAGDSTTLTNNGGTANGSGTSLGGLVGRSTGNVTNCSADVSNLTNTGVAASVGGLVGYNLKDGTVTGTVEITVTVNVAGRIGKFTETGGSINTVTVANMTNSGDNAHIGGLVGFNFGTIKKCSAEITGNLISEAYATYGSACVEVGGLVGNNYGEINSCRATVNSLSSGAAADWSDVGGLVGKNSSATVTGSVAQVTTMNVINVGGNGCDIGGLVGEYYNGTVNKCMSEIGALTCTGPDNNVGGLVGYNGGSKIQECYSTVENLKSDGSGDEVTLGGLAGYNYSSTAEIKNSWTKVTTMDAVNSNSADVGGLVGKVLSSKVNSCFAQVTTINYSDLTRRYMGKVVGYKLRGSITSCTATVGTPSNLPPIGYNG